MSAELKQKIYQYITAKANGQRNIKGAELAEVLNSVADEIEKVALPELTPEQLEALLDSLAANYISKQGMDIVNGEYASGAQLISSFNITGPEPTEGFYSLINYGEAQQTVAFRTSTLGANQPIKQNGTNTLSPNELSSSSLIKDKNNTTIGYSSKIRSNWSERWADNIREAYIISGGVTSSISIAESWDEVRGGVISWIYKNNGVNVTDFKFDNTGIYSSNYIVPSTANHYIQKGYLNAAMLINILQNASADELNEIKALLQVSGGSFQEAQGYDLTLLDS